MKGNIAPDAKWYRMDNSATVYPMIITLKTQSIYRLGVELFDVVDKENLKNALEKTLFRFPSFKVELKRGLFRHFFEENLKPPVIEEDDGLLLKNIDFKRNNGYLFRVTYFRNKIFVDLFHALCDGSGGMEFLKSLTFNYLNEAGYAIPDENKIKLTSVGLQHINNAEFDDSFTRYFTKIKLIEGAKAMAGKNAFGITGNKFKKEGYGLISGSVNTLELLALARRYRCSITVFVSALAMLSVAKVQLKAPSKLDMAVFIPINLRKIFPSDTIYNFTTFAKCIVPTSLPKNLEDYIEAIGNGLKQQLDKEYLQKKISFTSLMAVNPFLRYLPLPVKSFITKLGRLFAHPTRQTMIISNLGVIDMPSKCEKLVDSFVFNLNCSKKTPINLGLISYGRYTVFSFTRQIVSTDIEREFFSLLANFGLNVKVVSNLREVHNAL